MKKVNGFTLLELMITVAIVAILAAIALPNYTEHINKARRSEAQSALVELAARLHDFYVSQSPPSYIGASLGDDGIFPDEAPLNGSDKFYDLVISSQTANSFNIRSNPKGVMQGDFVFTLNSQGAKQHFRNNGSPIAGWP